MNEMTISQFLIRRLLDFGVRDVFCVSGGPISGILAALAEETRIRVHFLLHEQSAGIAAEAYAAHELRPVAVLVSSGPGSLNVMTPLAAAWTNSTPVIFLSGQVKTLDIENSGKNRQWGSQHVDTLSMVQGIVKFYARVTQSSYIEQIDNALKESTSKRMGPVWLEIPQDIQRHKIVNLDIAPITTSFQPIPQDDREQYSSFIHSLHSAASHSERPMVLLGNGFRLSREMIPSLIESLGWPVQTTWPALDFVSSSDNLYAGRSGVIATWFANMAIQSADLLLVLGARLDPGQVAFNADLFAKNARIFRVDIDEEEFRRLPKSRVTNLEGDCGQFVRDLISLELDWNFDNRFLPWRSMIREWKNNLTFFNTETFDQISTYELIEVVSKHSEFFPTIVSGSSGTCTEQVMQAIDPVKGVRVQNSGGLGSMGFGLAGAIGASIATNQPVLLLESDGSFAMNPQDLKFISHNNLPIKIVIMDSNGYKSIELSQKRAAQKVFGANGKTGVELLDPVEVARSMGIKSQKIEKSGHWIQDLSNLLKDKASPSLVQVVVSSKEEATPRVVSRMNNQGRMETPPMEEMWPPLSEDLRSRYWPSWL